MRFFLKGEINWFLRAIDDSWFNPDNLYRFVEQLESFLDPYSHVIIKSQDCPTIIERWDMSYMQGGAPILMSRAAVRHIASTFSSVCGSSQWPADDAALTLIVNRTFISSSAWGDVRFVSEPWNVRNIKARDQWNIHSSTHFQFLNMSCSLHSHYLRPLKVLVGAHTCGVKPFWRNLVELVSLRWFPDDLLLEYSKNESYVICRSPFYANLLASITYLKAVTPLITITDPRLNFTVPELWKWGFEHIPRFPWLPRRPYGLGPSYRV
jgi:hypothetical protein